MLKDLSSIEKMKIDCRVRRDVEKNLVFRLNYADYARTRWLSAKRDELVSVDDELIGSPFIFSELNRFAAERDRCLGEVNVRYWLMNASFRKTYRVRSLPRAIADINNQINVYGTRLELLADSYADKLSELNRKRKMHDAAGEIHIVQLCVNHAERCRLEFAEQTNDLYIGIIELLGQKIELLNEMEGRLLAIRSRIYRRIMYYCEAACSLKRELLPAPIKASAFEKYADLDLLKEYELVRADTHTQLEYYRNEFSRLEPGTDGRR